MEFNMLDGVSTQEIMLMKKALAELQKPNNESQLITTVVGSPTVVEGKYTGFSLKIPDSYTERIRVIVNDAWSITINPGSVYQVRDGILFSTVAGASTTMSVAPNAAHAIQKFSVIDKLEFYIVPVSEQPMGVEFDLVLSK